MDPPSLCGIFFLLDYGAGRAETSEIMILSIGEIVWDVIEGREILGGAPLNVACHLARLGHHTIMLSRVGNDELGRRTISRLKEFGLTASFIGTDPVLPTGRVLVSFKNGEPFYDIIYPAAWDAIEKIPDDTEDGGRYQLVFGTLAQRDERSRETIRYHARRAQKVFYDVNLRPPFTTASLTLESLELAEVVKMNREELDIVSDWAGLPGNSFAEKRETLRAHFGLQVLCITRGGSGALLVTPDGTFEHSGFKVDTVDTVGAGDAFFAALIDAMLRELDWSVCLQRANRLGALVAGRRGATPNYDPSVFD